MGDEAESEVNIRCLKSSEFVVGKQSNYNCPVTIINCIEEAKEQKSPGEEKWKKKEETVIVRNEVKAEVAENKERTTGEKGKMRRLAEKLASQLRLRLLFWLCALAASVFILAICLTLISAQEGENQGNQTFYYTKAEWGGKAAKSAVEMKLPLPYVVISHTVTPRCVDLRTCAPLLRNMQAYHFSLELADLQYNFLVDSKGHLYEARGWNKRNSKGGFVNGRNLNVALIGDYSDDLSPTTEMLGGLQRLLAFGLDNGKISASYSLLADNATYATLSPGKNVYAVIKNWPNFDPSPKSHVKGFDQP